MSELGGLFGGPVDPATVAFALDGSHYLGRARRGVAWSDDLGVLVLANPSSRRLPHDRWLELVRWCLVGKPNAGSQQWSRVVAWLRVNRMEITTVVSYSDPREGHTGALYRACNWLWAPTWHRMVPPPTGNGAWVDGEGQGVKDRWIFPLRPDDGREALLALDASYARRWPDASYREPQWKRGHRTGGGGRWRP